MATLRHYVSQVRSANKWIFSDNLASDRTIAAELKSVAYLLIKRETDKRKLLDSDTLFTQIDCLQLTPVSITECCNYTSPCQIAKSVKPIPKIAENIYGALIQGVYSIDKKVRFDYIDPSRYVNYLTLYPKDKRIEKFFWIRNGHLYITDPNIETISLSAFFEEDVDTSIYGCDCEEQNCPKNPLDQEFRCPGFLLNNVLTIVRDNFKRNYSTSTGDSQEDNRDDSK